MMDNYANIEVSRETRERLAALSDAFGKCYGHRVGLDELVARLEACVEDGDPAVWEEYCKTRVGE